jgi:hypothetical protein
MAPPIYSIHERNTRYAYSCDSLICGLFSFITNILIKGDVAFNTPKGITSNCGYAIIFIYEKVTF